MLLYFSDALVRHPTEGYISNDVKGVGCIANIKVYVTQNLSSRVEYVAGYNYVKNELVQPEKIIISY